MVKKEFDFYSVFSREKVHEIDKRIMESQKKYDACMRQKAATAKDFAMTH